MTSAIHSQAAPSKIAILGAGSWGSTLARLYALNGRTVRLWSRNEDRARRMQAERRVERPMPVEFPEGLAITGSLSEALLDAGIVLVCCPSQAMRDLAQKVSVFFRTGAGSDLGQAGRPVIVSASKGLELGTLKRMSEVLSESIPGLPVLALSGPNLAAEIAAGRPAASVVAGVDRDSARYAQEQLSVGNFRVYSNEDIAGVELGGALKNIIAIAAGCSDGLDLGANARAALITRGLAEMTRLAVALGAQPMTLAGLAGMGDLLATCTSPLSRNYRLGREMALGMDLAEALAALGATAEGVPTTEAVCELSKQHAIELPIAEQVENTLKGKTTPERAIMTLMTRPLVSENAAFDHPGIKRCD